MLQTIIEDISNWLISWGINQTLAEGIASVTDFLMTFVLAVILYYVTKFIIVKVLKRIAKRTQNNWDDVLYEQRVFHRMAFLIPGIIIYQAIPVTLNDIPNIIPIATKLTNIYIIITFTRIINSFLNALYAMYEKSGTAIYHPIKGYIQIGKILVLVISSLLILSHLFNQSPIYMLTGLGAFSAVLLLIFKDPILGFVGGIQLSANDMVRPGDWINMPKYSADGTVKEISLTTVKVQNFDNTITTLPTYSLVSESFQNYRGMKESGVRRIKRSISIDMSSVHFCSEEMLTKFKNVEILRQYIETTQQELEAYNQSNHYDNSVLVNGRRQTNLGIFRAYLNEYLSHNPFVNSENDQLVRQLQPTSSGIPIEVYAFVQETEFIKYEKIQSDIFDHILAIIPEFDLRVFQSPTGEDLRRSSVPYFENPED